MNKRQLRHNVGMRETRTVVKDAAYDILPRLTEANQTGTAAQFIEHWIDS
jgi:hypothetical protein